jgi:cephalosporin-C deacetylase-like acetyl esterase
MSKKKTFLFELRIILILISFLVIGHRTNCLLANEPDVLPNTELLTWNENCSERNNRFVTEFLDRKINDSINHRAKFWNRKFDSREDYENSVKKNRERFQFIIGVRDKRKQYDSPELCETLETSALLAETTTHKIYAIRWSVFELINGEGILLEPKNHQHQKTNPKTIIHIPDAGIAPEQIIGLTKADTIINETTNNSGFETAIDGCRVILPSIVDRKFEKYRHATLTNREYIYRAAFQLGRHIIGYEVQEILALVDWIKKTEGAVVRVEGYGEGGLIAFYAAAVDTRIDETVVAGYFNNRNRICDEPIDRNVFGLLEQFGDAEIASLIAPRKLIIVNRNAPELNLKSEKNGAPGILVKPENEVVKAEIERAKKLVEPLVAGNVAQADWIVFEPNEIINPSESELLLRKIIPELPVSKQFAKAHSTRIQLRNKRIVGGMDRHTQHLLEHSVLARQEFWKKHDASSPQKHAETIERYREYFAKDIIGRFDDLLVEPKPRTRLYKEELSHTIYEVELDVFDGVIVYGLILIPKGLTVGEKRPVVVCQHGLERSPSITLRGSEGQGYNGMSTVLCERGYVTFAPQNLYVLKDKFRFNQRQLNSLGKTLFSVMVPQHQQIINWLRTLEFVDGDKIAFYGLSYGGKTAMRVPPLVEGYCLSICSADFNYWNLKTASTLHSFSYIWSGEYEIFEFDLANTYDYSDMAKLIAPRPFMVERGHLDNVGRDEYVGFEFGKVRYFYDHYLKLPDRAEIHWFDNGHIINGEKTYPFLDRFLKEK